MTAKTLRQQEAEAAYNRGFVDGQKALHPIQQCLRENGEQIAAAVTEAQFKEVLAVNAELRAMLAKAQATERHEGPDYPDGPEFEGWAERSGQQPADVLAGLLLEARSRLEDVASSHATFALIERIDAALPSAPAVQCSHLPVSNDNGTWCELCEKKL